LTHFATSKLSHGFGRSQPCSRNVLIPLLPEGIAGDNLSVAFDFETRPLQSGSNSAFDILIGNPIIMPIIGDGRRLENATRFFIDEDELELFPG
jgi:hypothetical protein